MNTTELPPLPESDGSASVPIDEEKFTFTEVEAWSESLVRQAQAAARNAVIDQIVDIIRNTQAGAKRLTTADYILTLKIDAAPTGPAQPDGEQQ